MTEHLDRLRTALASHYTIEREIGSGGMATVYLAEDPKHHRKVAVKVLRPDLAATLGPTRFLREIEIAAQLQHPHILPLLDSGESDGVLYYVMPFIEGQTLRERLSRGELPVGEAVRLLRDVADALSYAHSRGVVHRDIKPDNVMIAGRHALVMDFGVAKAVSEATGRQSLTTAGIALGTPAYMAPEQAAADPFVDHRADIYALGAMGYELLTGQPPFTGLTPQQVLAAHVTEAPKPVTERRAACPPALADTIMRCLAKRAADRWQSADEVLEQLEALGGTPSGGSTPAHTQPTTAVAAPTASYGHPVRVGGLYLLASVAILGVVYFLTIQLGLPDWVPLGALALLAAGLPIMLATGVIERRRAEARATGMYSVSTETPLKGLFTWQRAVRGGYVAFAVLGFGTVGYTAMRLLGIGPVGTLLAAGKLSAKDAMIVADFDNRTPDSTLGSSLSEAFRIDLAQSPVIKVLTSSALTAGLQRMGRDSRQALDLKTAQELAVREGAKAVVAGEISSVGRSYVLAARLVSAGDGAELLALRENAADDGQILAALDRLSKQLRERVGESLRTIRANEPLAQVTTSSLEALRLYTEGVHASDLNENERAADLLRQAVAIDSGFAMAWRKLAVVGANADGSLQEQVDAVRRAYQNRERLPELEKHLTTAYYFSVADRDREKAAAAYRAALTVNPDSPIALNNLGNMEDLLGHYAESEELYRHAIRVGTAQVHSQLLIRSLVAQRKLDEARAAISEFNRRWPGSSGGAMQEAAFLVVTGQYDSAQRSFARFRVQAREIEDQASGSWELGMMEQLRGRLQNAERQLADLVAVSERRKLPGTALGVEALIGYQHALYGGDSAAAVRLLDEALARRPLAGVPPADRPYTSLAMGYAVAGRPDRARQLLKEYESVIPEGIRRSNPFRFAAAGWLALAEDHPAQAAKAFDAANRDAPPFPTTGLYGLGLAYERAGKADSALAAYQRLVDLPPVMFGEFETAWSLGPTYQRLGELYEAKGDKDKALEYYGKFTDLWSDADPVLQPKVREAKSRMAKLSAERSAAQ